MSRELMAACRVAGVLCVLAVSSAAFAAPLAVGFFLNHWQASMNTTSCIVRLDAEIGDPAATPNREHTNRIAYSTTIQCDPDETHADVVDDGLYVVKKTIVRLSLCSTNSGCVNAPLPPTTTNNALSAIGEFDAGLWDANDLYEIRATVRLENGSFGQQYFYSVSSSGAHWTPGILSGEPQCLNTEGSWAAIECNIQSPPFTLADVHGRHFLASGTKFYKACTFNSARANISGGAARLNFGSPTALASTVTFTDPAARCTTVFGEAGEVVSMAFVFQRSAAGEDVCGSQRLADTEVLNGYMRINGGPQIPAKMLVKVTPLGSFEPLIEVSIMDDQSINNPMSRGDLLPLDFPVYPAPALNDEFESITNLHSYLLPQVAPSFGSNIVTSKVKKVGSGGAFLEVPSTDQLICDRPEVRFEISGTLQEPENRTDDGIRLGSGIAVHGAEQANIDGIVEPSTNDTGEAIEALTAINLTRALSSLGNIASHIPNLPVAPPFPYVIKVEYWSALLGKQASTKVPAIFGVPQVVVLPPDALGTDAFVVTLGTTNQTASVKGLVANDGGNYIFRVERVNAAEVLAADVPDLPDEVPLPPEAIYAPPLSPDGDFEVRWSQPISPNVTGLCHRWFILETARNSDFSGASELYRGELKEYRVRPPSTGMHYFRVKARSYYRAGLFDTCPWNQDSWTHESGYFSGPNSTNVLQVNAIPSNTCNPTPVNITAEVSLSTIAALTGGTPIDSALEASDFISIGYDALGRGASDSPKDFALIYLQHGESGFSVHQRNQPCSTATTEPLSVVGKYRDGSGEGTDVTIRADMTPAVNSFDLVSFRDGEGKETLAYRGSPRLDKLEIGGTLDGGQLTVRALNLENVDYCSHSGNLCNMEWRKHRRSQQSANFRSWDNGGNDLTASFFYYSLPLGGGITTANLALSKLAVDSKTFVDEGSFWEAEGNRLFGGVASSAVSNIFGIGGDFPYWVYITTGGSPVKGTFSDGKLDLRAPVTGFSTSGRELVARRKWYGLRLCHHGKVSCGDLTLNTQLPGIVTDYLTTEFCRGKDLIKC